MQSMRTPPQIPRLVARSYLSKVSIEMPTQPPKEDRGPNTDAGYQGGQSGWSRQGAYEDQPVEQPRDYQGRSERQDQGGELDDREPGYDYDNQPRDTRGRFQKRKP